MILLEWDIAEVRHLANHHSHNNPAQAEAFARAGVPAAHVDGDVTPGRRRRGRRRAGLAGRPAAAAAAGGGGGGGARTPPRGGGIAAST